MLMREMTLLVAVVRKILFTQAAEMMLFIHTEAMTRFTPLMAKKKITMKSI